MRWPLPPSHQLLRVFPRVQKNALVSIRAVFSAGVWLRGPTSDNISFSQMAWSPAVRVQLGNSSLTPHLTRGHLLHAGSVLGVGVPTHANILVGEAKNPKQVNERTWLESDVQGKDAGEWTDVAGGWAGAATGQVLRAAEQESARRLHAQGTWRVCVRLPATPVRLPLLRGLSSFLRTPETLFLGEYEPTSSPAPCPLSGPPGAFPTRCLAHGTWRASHEMWEQKNDRVTGPAGPG